MITYVIKTNKKETKKKKEGKGRFFSSVVTSVYMYVSVSKARKGLYMYSEGGRKDIYVVIKVVL